MRIADFKSLTTIDYPGQLACIIYTQGCNLSCKYCFNKELIPVDVPAHITEERVLEMIEDTSILVSAAVITGGEPLIQDWLIPFIRRLRDIGLLVKMNTNGTIYEVLKQIVDGKEVDFITMDIKGPMYRYKEICGTDEYNDNIRKSAKLLTDSDIASEFRTTFDTRIMSWGDISNMIEEFGLIKRHVLQPCKEIVDAS